MAFFPAALSPTLSEIAAWTGASLADPSRAAERIGDVAAIDAAGPGDLTFLDNPRYLPQLAATRAAAVFVHAKYAGATPPACAALVTPQPYRAIAETMAKLFPSAARPASGFEERGVSAAAHVHPTARLEANVIVDPGAVIGPEAEIGAGAMIGANAVIGPRVRIGRDAAIGANATIACALIGDRVIVHPGAHIGQDGFGFAMGPRGHLKVPQIGRVVIQDDVEIGAGATIDRGANRDTVIGEGTKIDNLVQIGHNVVIGRHCVIVSQVGISGSCVIDDFVALGGQVGLAGHLHIGAGAQIGAASGVMNDVPAGQRWFGIPAQPAREHFREIATLRKLAKGGLSAPEKG
ncbi:MAG: UDP-3-O-(3-hydroxymyristoyl)glucosamine N-acyltransferase [Pseudomonadota bacterium]|nr:UDP-3-O-(3-hydroxymyristoyl)glucosamine N-acyltransferase [Pseudomonadota bacterium]